MRAALSALAAAGLVLGSSTPAAAAEAPVGGLASNYWWEAEVSGSTLPSPPTVPAGGLWVESDPTGPEALSAVRFTLVAGASDPVLTLDVDSAQPAPSGGSGPGVVACPTASDWKPGPGPSAWSSRPTADCASGAVTGTYSASGDRLSFALASLLTASGVDVVIQAGPTGLGTPAESITFAPVVASDVAVTVAPVAIPSTVTPSAPAPLPAAVVPTEAPTTTVAAPPVASAGLGGTSAVATGAAPSLAPPATTPASAPSSATSRTGSGSAPALAGAKSRSWRDRLLLAIAVFDIALYLLYQRQAEPAGAATVPVRVGRPPALR